VGVVVLVAGDGLVTCCEGVHDVEYAVVVMSGTRREVGCVDEGDGMPRWASASGR
jgi:hypothetical protein